MNSNINTNEQADTKNTNENWTQRYVDYDKEEPQPRDISNDYIKEEMVGNVRGVFIKTRNLEPNEIENSNLQSNTSELQNTSSNNFQESGLSTSTNQGNVSGLTGNNNVSGWSNSGNTNDVSGLPKGTDNQGFSGSSGLTGTSSSAGISGFTGTTGSSNLSSGYSGSTTTDKTSGLSGENKGTSGLSSGSSNLTGDNKGFSGVQDQTSFGQISNDRTNLSKPGGWNDNKNVTELPPRNDINQNRTSGDQKNFNDTLLGKDNFGQGGNVGNDNLSQTTNSQYMDKRSGNANDNLLPNVNKNIAGAAANDKNLAK